jgi:hypothetical protein
VPFGRAGVETKRALMSRARVRSGRQCFKDFKRTGEEKGEPVQKTGSPFVRGECESYGAALTIASVVKKSRPTAPMLMYQHSRSGVSLPGR